MEKPNKLNIPPNYFYISLVITLIPIFIFKNLKIINFPYNLIGIIFLGLGIWIELWAYFLFKKADTPEDFSKTTSFVEKGPYKFSRNPMYLGMLLILLGTSILVGNIISFISIIFFFIIIETIFIPYEEKEMSRFKAYENYKKRVRKWI